MSPCLVCGGEIPTERSKPTHGHKRVIYCSKECGRKAWAISNPNRVRAFKKKWGVSNIEKIRELNYKNLYGIGIEGYNKILEEQHGVCAICGKPDKAKQKLSVDHSHITNKVRGLLCFRCNNALGCMDDDEDRLINAVEYLRKDKDKSKRSL